ncbi:NADPH-dependent F420 reductase [Maribacter sp. 2307ULW6-5]|uniref:NADPH-dependent F420 reductase n=1 Tax=Maribacter sp. 2307ULW6-5 TaxID=3386275 RepID=UPI0039BCA688
MKIGIIGAGNIGGNLGKHFAKAGHQVMFSSRHPEQLKHLVKAAGQNASAANIEEAAECGELILLAIPFGKVPATREKIGTLAGKILIDANNYYPQRDGAAFGKEMTEKRLLESEWTASYFTKASVLKAFNSISYVTLTERAFPETDKERLAIPFAGSDGRSIEVFKTLLNDIGFDGVHIGDLAATKAMQPNEKLYGTELPQAKLKDVVKKLYR